MRLAVLIIAHTNERQVNRLITHLAPDFDVYIHIDRRSKLHIIKHPNVVVLREYEVYWSSFNQVLAELALLRAAHQKGYDRYVLISGMDMPLKSNGEIRAFFEGNTSEYIDYRKLPCDGWPDSGALDRMTRYYPDWKHFTKSDRSIIRRAFVKLVNIIFRRRPIDYQFYGGSQWYNLTGGCVTELLAYLEVHPEYMTRYKMTSCSDEIFFQTALSLLGCRDIIHDCLRYVDWSTDPKHPKTLGMEDLGKLEASTALFARKFDETVDSDVIDELYRRISPEPRGQA